MNNEYVPQDGFEVLYFAGGCFWGMEKAFRQLDGVIETVVGYANGMLDFPSYEEVCNGETGHRETVRVTYDPSVIDINKLLEAFFICIDPSVKNRQGFDIGTQYQTGVYYSTEKQFATIKKFFEEERKKHKRFEVELAPLSCFWPAEEYHQDYLTKHPYGYCHISSAELYKVRVLNDK